MDLAYWGFYRWPFDRRRTGAGPNIGTSHEEALARLLFLVDEHRRCGMLTGAAGIGKSCLLQRVKSYANRHGQLCVEIDATGIDSSELASQLADQILTDCDAESTPARCWSKIHERMAALALVKQPIAVLIDHFDLVEFGCSQALRRLLHLADVTRADLTILIAARERFTAPLLLDAVELSIELTPWTEEETARFITAAARDAGATTPLFSDDAARAIQDVTRGVPAEVVWLCDLCLLAAMSRDVHHIDGELVQSAAAELSPRDWLLPSRNLATSRV